MKNKLLKKFKIYVAGHNGMVGRAVIRYLKQEGVKKLIFKNRKKLNLLNSKDLEKYIKSQKPDIIINCAGRVGGILANASYPVEFINENIFIQLNLINLAYKYKIKHFINLGSSCIYPKNSKQPIKEQYLLSNELEKTNEAYA
jgi:GDP-L-fucose synthase